MEDVGVPEQRGLHYVCNVIFKGFIDLRINLAEREIDTAMW